MADDASTVASEGDLEYQPIVQRDYTIRIEFFLEGQIGQFLQMFNREIILLSGLRRAIRMHTGAESVHILYINGERVSGRGGQVRLWLVRDVMAFLR